MAREIIDGCQTRLNDFHSIDKLTLNFERSGGASTEIDGSEFNYETVGRFRDRTCLDEHSRRLAGSTVNRIVSDDKKQPKQKDEAKSSSDPFEKRRFGRAFGLLRHDYITSRAVAAPIEAGKANTIMLPAITSGAAPSALPKVHKM